MRWRNGEEARKAGENRRGSLSKAAVNKAA